MKNLKNGNTKKIATLGILLAITIILSRFLALRIPPTNPYLQISFQFVPIAVSGILFGPLYTGLMCVAVDLFGAIFFPVGAFHIGYTISALLTGLVYGFFLHQKDGRLWKTVAASAIVNFLIHFVLGSFWLYTIMQTAAFAYLPLRGIKAVVMCLIEIPIIQYLKSRAKDFYK